MSSYHLIGIKGSGMSALAQMLHDLGHVIQGEDIDTAIFTQTPLEARNIPMYSFGSAPLSADMIVIASNAYGDDHPSVIRCKSLGLPIQRYHHFLGEWMKSYTSIAITGSHGKTTTTGMMVHALHSIEPTCSLIGDATGRGEAGARFFIFESCEYKRHFLAYRPEIAVITNIDFDHPDYFADVEDVRHAFEEMAASVGKQLVACGDDAQVRLLRTANKMLYYGFDERNELRAAGLAIVSGGVAFDVYWRDAKLDRFTIPVYGRHNVLNALAVIGVSLTLGLDLKAIRRQMATFTGVKRRFTETEWRSNVVIDDYAHHPSEIRATLEAARSKYPGRKIVSVFQPHTFSRLERLLDDFAHSLRDADDVFLCQIFGSARERAGSVSIEHLRERIPNAQLISESTVNSLVTYEDAVLVFMGAGDIQKYQQSLVRL
ncbi:UDP-N-acetylmuramate--L-alanine ligase [Paenibacillus apiarius]|uniref:UDP-N-acetylmuramate--L-alanine ligase n=1 Tax=Paenibacillus apiarius TaxID=46240 RepID=A0ABT4E1R7_9BACL|nr:UDP-N-acetylmuramate--L-alanine ligase [Paenibacillus apiarius]MCY9516966.1 UDP-N-acetylmuramate--L-alanine ligase [Paenibacillus apiarius]MCY9523552.1 UDP-N-acetylmuramate--L-alanine ligase [Paenibacillus apiarius]MCY9554803.1 UDP-N-acetylmuramate--L-alanine ligase [Paenibacillus apiarius]MCY9561338.1 UDP-N-acetylmuramate--L-alanine ligase [Paenibacillus apiarius]MCY9686945.1 UDP-N-acetylmuramate--L-alanine ligase [Paenibacillus apiarius]